MAKTARRAPARRTSGRWSARRKADAVLRLLKGEGVDTLSRQLKVTTATLSEWRDVFLENGMAALSSDETDRRDTRDGRDDEIAVLQRALAETALVLSLSRAMNTAYGMKAGLLSPEK